MRIKFDDPSEILPPGQYTYSVTFRGTILIEEGEEFPLMEILDESVNAGGEMCDWEVTAKV